jgi:hypothetical protein
MTTRAETKTEARLLNSHDPGYLAVAAALTPEQLDIVQARVHFVPPRWRDKFLRAVADQLALTRSPTNKAVLEACAAARRGIAVGIGPPSVESW